MSDRTLILLRHAKSAWKDTTLKDIERPLKKRGRRDAADMAPRLREYGATYTTIFASPARRSRETIARM
ncbi:MAG TPA: histidine phosphatase family protein, partial [Halioglobus sp.]